MPTAISSFQAATGRCQLYAFLCLAASPPGFWPTDWLRPSLKRLRRRIATGLPLPVARAELLELPRGLAEVAVPDLAVEHLRLERSVPPYESHYRDADGLLMGEATVGVLQAYSEADLAVDVSWADLPDHLLAELEFMVHLTDREAACWRRQAQPLAERWLERQEEFLQSHLGRWLPAYVARVQDAEPLRYYRSLSQLLLQTVELDRGWVAGIRRYLAK